MDQGYNPTCFKASPQRTTEGRDFPYTSSSSHIQSKLVSDRQASSRDFPCRNSRSTMSFQSLTEPSESIHKRMTFSRLKMRRILSFPAKGMSILTFVFIRGFRISRVLGSSPPISRLFNVSKRLNLNIKRYAP